VVFQRHTKPTKSTNFALGGIWPGYYNSLCKLTGFEHSSIPLLVALDYTRMHHDSLSRLLENPERHPSGGTGGGSRKGESPYFLKEVNQ